MVASGSEKNVNHCPAVVAFSNERDDRGRTRIVGHDEVI